MMFRCLSCGGVYSDMQTDGGSYFHVCPTGTNNPRDENPDPTAPLLEFQSEHGHGMAKKYRPRTEGLGRVEVTS